MQEGDKSTFFRKLSSSKVQLHTPSSTYCKNMSQNATISEKRDFKEGYVT